MPQAQSVDLPTRLPLVAVPSNRDETTNKDAKLVNGYVEKTETEEYFVYKRPGLLPNTTLSGNGYGTYNWQSDVYAINGATLYKNGGAISGIVNSSNGVYQFSSCLGETPKLFFMNGIKAYTYDDTNGLVEVSNTTPITTTGNVTSGSKIIPGIPSTAGMAENNTITGAGIPLGAYIVTVDSGVQVTINTDATATGVGEAIVVTPVGIPSLLVKGAVYLDGTMYVMDSAARIFGSDINDPQTWPPLTNLVAQIEPDGGVALAKQLVYVLALKEWTTEVFYDAGNAVGSPLGAVQGARVSYGCASAESVQDIDGMLFWLSTNRSAGFQVLMLEQLQPRIISTKAIERLLDKADTANVASWTFKNDGHNFYFLTLKTQNITLCFDVREKLWHQWTDTNANYFPIVSSTYNGSIHYLQHETNGLLYNCDMAYTTDNGALIQVDLYTPNFDGGVRRRKHLKQLELIADQSPGSLLQMRKSDDDFQTWSNFRTIDLSKKRPMLTDCGTFYKRVHHFRHRCNTSLRLQAVELQMDIGTL